MLLYKYLSLASTIVVLKNKTFKISNANKLNDIFEFKPIININEYGSKMNLGLLEQFKIKDQIIKKASKHAATRFCLCFSATNDDLLMWSHYSDSYKGIVLEFESTSLFPEDVKYEMKPVSYRTKKQIIQNPKRNIKEIQESLFIKPKCWSYEEEIRFIIKNKDTKKQDFTFVQFNQNSLKSIIIGPRIIENDYELLAKFIISYENNYKKTCISKCIISNNEYKLIIEHSSSNLIDSIVGLKEPDA